MIHPRFRRSLAAALLLSASAGTALAQIELYAVDFPGNFYLVNQSTGAATLIGFTGTDRLNSAAANSQGVIFASRGRNPTIATDVNQLIRIDRITGQGTLIADYAQENDLRGLAFGPGDVLYGIRDIQGLDDLVTIDATTGAVTLVGPTGRSDVQGLTATDTGELYAVGVSGGGIGGGLYRINPLSGAATVISPGMNAGSDVQTIEWIEGNDAWIGRANLRRVSLLTGAPVTVGPLGVGDVRGLAAVRPVSCYANCDGSTQEPILNVADFSCFLSKFAAADPYANCDNSTQEPILNVADFSCFLSKFAAGCP